VSARECVVVIDDDRAIADGLAMLLDRRGLTTFLCADVESAELVLARHRVTRVLTDVQFSGPFGFEGLHLLTRIRAQQPDCRIVLMTGYASNELRQTALRAGAAAVLAKPFASAELELALDFAPVDDSTEPYEVVRVDSIDDILHGGLTAVFQPIVRLENGTVTTLGYEALTRVRSDWACGGVTELFDYASQKERLTDLNLAAIGSALGAAKELPAHASLFLNVDPLTFDRPELVRTLRSAMTRNGVSATRVVLEITERSGLGQSGAAAAALAQLRADGVRFALDDLGSAHSHLAAINDIRPDFIKISHTFGTAFDEDPTRTRIVRHVVALARDFGCRTVLEGIETAATARAAFENGIELGQGYHFGRPNVAAHWTAAAVAA
jgi:EAL domain-containing protein (putative c-di-GMP-specific phosphodiesterase class I)